MRQRRLGASLLLVLVAACSPSPIRSAAPPPSPAPAGVAVEDDGRCLWGARKGYPGDVTTAIVDVDGDGQIEVVVMDRRGPCYELASWHLRVEGPARPLVERDLSDSFGGVGTGSPYVMGGIDLDGDGAEEIWAHTGTDAVHPRFALFAVHDDRLDYVRLENGQPAEFSVGTPPKFPGGVACEPAGDGTRHVVATSSHWDTELAAPKGYTVRTYQLDGPVLRLLDERRTEGGPLPADAWDFTCGPVVR